MLYIASQSSLIITSLIILISSSCCPKSSHSSAHSAISYIILSSTGLYFCSIFSSHTCNTFSVLVAIYHQLEKPVSSVSLWSKNLMVYNKVQTSSKNSFWLQLEYYHTGLLLILNVYNSCLSVLKIHPSGLHTDKFVNNSLIEVIDSYNEVTMETTVSGNNVS